MVDADRELVASLRAELAAIDPIRACDRVAERAGLAAIDPAGSATPAGSSTPAAIPDPARTGDPVVARLAVRLARAGEDGRSATDIHHPVALARDRVAWAALPDHCRLAWLRGRFLGHGSLSLAGGRVHLEFVVAADEASILAERLRELGLPASWRLRRGRGVVTWKRGEWVTTFLRRIGAGSGLLELEARQVSRTLRGELNRVLNAESANVARSVVAASRQIEAIARLEADGMLAEQPRVVRAVAVARRETPEATLTELAARVGVHRSAAQRALDRIERLALHDEPRRRDAAIPLA